MAIVRVQNLKDPTTSGSSTGTINITCTTGNLLVAALVTSLVGTTVDSITGGGNTLVRRSGRAFASGAGGSEIWSLENITGGTFNLVAAFSATVSYNYYLIEYSGCATASAFDQQNSAVDTSGTSNAPNSGNITTTQADEVLVGIATHGGATTWTATGAGWTDLDNADFPSRLLEQIVAATGTYAANGTISAGANWTACVASFKGAGAGATWPGYLSPFGWR